MKKYSNQIIKLRNEGKTYKEIVNILGCAFSTVSYHCTLHKLGSNNQRPTKEEIENFQKLYDELGSVKKVCKITNRSKETVSKYVLKRKIEKKITNSESVILWRKKKKIELIEYKGGKCEICGYNKCNRALQFHHRNPTEKDFTISGRSLSFERLKNEVDKCVLVCSNCHSEIHDGIIKI